MRVDSATTIRNTFEIYDTTSEERNTSAAAIVKQEGGLYTFEKREQR